MYILKVHLIKQLFFHILTHFSVKRSNCFWYTTVESQLSSRRLDYCWLYHMAEVWQTTKYKTSFNVRACAKDDVNTGIEISWFYFVYNLQVLRVRFYGVSRWHCPPDHSISTLVTTIISFKPIKSIQTYIT